MKIADVEALSGAFASVSHPIPQGFFSFLLKPYVKVMTPTEKLEWWNTLMVEYLDGGQVSLFFHYLFK